MQIVESVRVDGKIRQRILRHAGVAHDDREKQALWKIAEHIKAKMLHERQPGLFPPEHVAEMAIESSRKPKDALPTDDLGSLYEEQRVISGIHEVYGHVYRAIGLDHILSAKQQKISNRILYHTVLARIANPEGRRSGVRFLKQDFGVSIALEKVYRMMDLLDEAAIGRIRERTAATTRSLFPDPIDLVSFDCTTLFFGSRCEDTLRALGYGKDGRHGEVQVLLALAVTRSGLPIGYEVFPGNMWEGNGFLPALRTLHPDTRQAVIVADAGMSSDRNLTDLGNRGCSHIVGARLRGFPKAVKDRVLKVNRYRNVMGETIKVGVFRHDGRRIVVSYNPKRARKDARDREKALTRLLRRLRNSDAPEQLPGKGGYHRFVRIAGDAHIELDTDRIKAEEAWDGLHGVVTRLKGMPVAELFNQYRQLWQVEESFRITKHDLRARPVFHWTERRIRAHPAISFMAYACVRHLAYRVAAQKQPMSPKVIQTALRQRQFSVLHDPENSKHHAIPSMPGAEAKAIYATLGLATTTRPFEIRKPDGKPQGDWIHVFSQISNVVPGKNYNLLKINVFLK